MRVLPYRSGTCQFTHRPSAVVSSSSSSSSENSPVVLRKKNVEREPERKASTTSIPPPPPPMPKEAPKTTAVGNNNATKRASTISRTPSQQDIMYEELKSVLDQFSQRSKLDIRKTPEAFISSSASSTEVQQWLKAKEFDDSVQKRLKGMNGTELFALKKDQLEKYFGKDEGHRLYSQLTIQRNTSGYKTTRSSELRAALERARKRAEAEEAARNAATLKTKKNYDQESD